MSVLNCSCTCKQIVVDEVRVHHNILNTLALNVHTNDNTSNRWLHNVIVQSHVSIWNYYG